MQTHTSYMFGNHVNTIGISLTVTDSSIDSQIGYLFLILLSQLPNNWNVYVAF